MAKQAAEQDYQKEKLNERITELPGGVTVTQVEADVVKRAVSCKNVGVNGSVVLSSDNQKYGYNVATGEYEDLMVGGIIDPIKVVRCCLEHAASVARTFLTSYAVVVDIKEAGPVAAGYNSDFFGGRVASQKYPERLVQWFVMFDSLHFDIVRYFGNFTFRYSYY